MKVRVVLVCTLLLLAAVPSFALDRCKECINLECKEVVGAFEKCYSGPGYCYTDPRVNCSHGRSGATVLADWTVASIEISRPAQEGVETASVQVNEVSTPAPEATELK